VAVVRLDSTLTPDAGFGHEGRIFSLVPARTVSTITIQPDGRIVILVNAATLPERRQAFALQRNMP
jgi:hypothetical protein